MAMALRPIDNALPVPTPERPKKQAKVAVPVRKQPEFSANDENKAPKMAETVDYVASESLNPILDPDSKIQVSSFCFCLFLFYLDYIFFFSCFGEIRFDFTLIF